MASDPTPLVAAPGAVVGGRFRLEREVGRGGMGSIFRAIDMDAGVPVALKTLVEPEAEAMRRFAREAETLRQLRHPGIVRYVAHGSDAFGPWIAMEWVEGRTLGQRLGDGRLTADQARALAGRVAAALGVAHAAGVVHRDIKPDNLLLPSERCEDVVLVDFGIARDAMSARTFTMPGVILGTPPYMAPEQVRGARDLGPRADVFSLGCVLWECLTGRVLFEAERPIAVLLRVLVEAAPRLRDVVSDVPPKLDELVAEMLAKDPAERPADGAALVERLAAITETADVVRARRISPSNDLGVLTTDELRLFSLLLARMPADVAGATTTTVRVPAPEELADLMRELAVRCSALGAAIHRLADGSIVAFVTDELAPPEVATRVARIAGLVRRALPGWSVVITTGRGDAAGDLPVGDVVDRAVAMWSPDDAVAIDELTAQLVDESFTVVRGAAELQLGPPRPRAEGGRRVRSPFVGRAPELRLLERAVEQAVRESRPRAVVVIGPPGAGKTRLQQELVRRLSPEIVAWVGRGDPLRRDAPLAVLSDAIRDGLGLPTAAEPLAELLGIPLADLPERGDPAQFARRIEDAFVRWLASTTQIAPVLLVLEDVQWVDASSLRLAEAALRTQAPGPLVVLALSRPEGRERVAELPAEHLELAPLEPGSAAELARALVGPAADAATVARIARESEGHPLLLEELARSLGKDQPEAARATALGIVERRLSARPLSERRVLRAAAVLGPVFWRGAVSNLLGEPDGDASSLDEILSSLCAAEIIDPAPPVRFAGEPEFRFRHDLFREAAYETLTSEDRRLGHRRAGKWLEDHGERDAALLAEHHDRGGSAERAAKAHLEAAVRALRVGDVEASARHAERGLAHAEESLRRADLSAVLAEALMWLGKLDQSRQLGWEALDALRAGSSAWHRTAANLASTISRAKDADAAVRLAARVVESGSIDSVEAALSAAQIAERLVRMSLDEQARRVLDRATPALIRSLSEIDRVVEPMWRFAEASQQSHAGLTDQALRGFRWAADRFGEIGERRHELAARVQLASFQIVVGQLSEARASIEAAAELSRALGARPLRAYCAVTSATLTLYEGRPREAAAELAALMPDLEAMEDPMLLAYGMSQHAAATLQLGDRDAALAEAERAAAVLEGRPEPDLDVLGVLARTLIDRDPARAVRIATGAVAFADARGQFLVDDMECRLALVEGLAALGRNEEARAQIASARQRILAHAARLADPEIRRSLCEGVPVNARVLALAKAWIGE